MCYWTFFKEVQILIKIFENVEVETTSSNSIFLRLKFEILEHGNNFLANHHPYFSCMIDQFAHLLHIRFKPNTNSSFPIQFNQ